MLHNKTAEKYPLFTYLLPLITISQDSESSNMKNVSLQIASNQETPNLKSFTIDEIMTQYLVFIFEYTNSEYFHFSILFLILLREFLNTFTPFNQKLSSHNLAIEYTAELS